MKKTAKDAEAKKGYNTYWQGQRCESLMFKKNTLAFYAKIVLFLNAIFEGSFLSNCKTCLGGFFD